MIAQDLKTEAGQRDHYSAVKARLNAKRAADGAAERLAAIKIEREAEEERKRQIAEAVKTAFGTPRKALEARWKQIIAEVADKHQVNPMEILSQRREKYIILARHEAVWRIRNETPLSFPQIGVRMNRDHSTLIHSVKMHEKRIAAGEAK